MIMIMINGDIAIAIDRYHDRFNNVNESIEIVHDHDFSRYRSISLFLIMIT